MSEQAAAPGPRWFEDLVPGLIERFGRHEVTREAGIAFAASYDMQPFHLDDAAAADNPLFGRLAISGWQSCAISMRLIVEHLRDSGLQHASLGGSGIDELRWLKPVHPGDILRCEQEVLEARPLHSRTDAGLVRQRTTLLDQHGDAVLRYTATVLFKRRPGG